MLSYGSLHDVVYSLHTRKESRFGQRHGLQSLTMTSYFYKNIYHQVIYLYLWKYFLRQIYSYDFCILKLNNLKVIHDLYSQCLTQTLSKTTSFSSMDGVIDLCGNRQCILYKTAC